MKVNDNSEKTARLMLDDYVKTVTDEQGDSIEAVILVGSLVYGGYIPGPGDIDQITILKNDAEEGIEQKALALIKKTMGRYNNAVNIATETNGVKSLHSTYLQSITYEKIIPYGIRWPRTFDN